VCADYGLMLSSCGHRFHRLLPIDTRTKTWMMRQKFVWVPPEPHCVQRPSTTTKWPSWLA